MVDSACIHPEASASFGSRPSPGVCSLCPHYSGPSRGLGDIVHSITTATGIAPAVHAILGSDCGCAERRAAMNAAMPFTDRA